VLGAGKDTQSDKKLREVIDERMEELTPTSPEMSATPIGDMNDAERRKMFVRLISTMNAASGDYDFRCVVVGLFSGSTSRRHPPPPSPFLLQ
jgi:hypothetical protein